MEETKEYKPVYVEFNVADDWAPETLGEFADLNEATKFIHENAVALNIGITTQRHMDNTEKKEIRNRYMEILEDELPKVERESNEALSLFNQEKSNLHKAQERVNASTTEAKLLAKEVKIGLKEFRCNELSTFRIPFNGKYYFYTFYEKQLRLCAIRDISSTDAQELFTKGVDNSKIFTNTQFDSVYINPEKILNEPVTTQKGKKK